MAWEKTAHRPPSRLAPSPPSKIKAPCHFSLDQGKNPSLCEIPYQSPKKCLKTQITTFSILKFSPKTKNTPVLTVFTLFLLSSYYYSHHPIILINIPHFLPFEDSTTKDIQQIIVYLPLSVIIIVCPPPPISILKFHERLSDIEIPANTMPKVPQKSHKNDLF